MISFKKSDFVQFFKVSHRSNLSAAYFVFKFWTSKEAALQNIRRQFVDNRRWRNSKEILAKELWMTFGKNNNLPTFSGDLLI